MWAISDFPMEPMAEVEEGGDDMGSGAMTVAATATALAAMLLL